MDEIYNVPKLSKGEVHQTELIIKKSRFITSIAHTATVEECKEFIAKISAQYADANHNCFAFNATKPFSSAFCGCSDDGEPHGTAGRPMLNVLLHQDVGEITVVVTRYFGGILLGTGGLVKAYQDSVKEGLLSLETTERMIPSYLYVTIEHRFITQFLRMLEPYRASIEDQKFLDRASYKILLPASNLENFSNELVTLTHGSALISKE